MDAAPPKTLWMGAVQASWDENFVISLFKAQDGDAPVSVKLIRNPTSQPVGYAFLDFASHEDAKRVLATYNGTPIPGLRGVHFRLNWGSGTRRSTTSSVLTSDSLFVGDLAPEVKDATLFEHFSKQFPNCVSGKVVVDPNTGLSKGYGFVKFADRQQCEQALTTMNGTTLMGRPIRVSVATTKRSEPKHSYMPLDMTRALGAPQYDPYYPPLAPASVPYGYMMEPPLVVEPRTSEDSRPLVENTTVFVGNLDPNVTEDQLREHFSHHGAILHIKIPPNRGCGFIRFETHEAASNAISQMNGSILGSLRVRLDWGKAPGHHSRPPVPLAGLQVQDDLVYSVQHQQYAAYMAHWQASQMGHQIGHHGYAPYYRYGQFPKVDQPPPQPRQEADG